MRIEDGWRGCEFEHKGWIKKGESKGDAGHATVDIDNATPTPAAPAAAPVVPAAKPAAAPVAEPASTPAVAPATTPAAVNGNDTPDLDKPVLE